MMKKLLSRFKDEKKNNLIYDAIMMTDRNIVIEKKIKIFPVTKTILYTYMYLNIKILNI